MRSDAWLDVSGWPLDGSQWIAKTAEALRSAGVEPEAIERFTRALYGIRDFSLIQEDCEAALARHYEVKLDKLRCERIIRRDTTRPPRDAQL